MVDLDFSLAESLLCPTNMIQKVKLTQIWLLSLFLSLSAYAEGTFSDRIKQAVESSLTLKVESGDAWGEGPQAWDADPLYSDTYNCMTWVQHVIAKAYSSNQSDYEKALTNIKYFGGVPSFGTRKHFVDSWFSIGPGPLESVDLTACSNSIETTKSLNRSIFIKSSGYKCPLYDQDMTAYKFRYVSGEDLIKCTSSLDEGYYILSAAPTTAFHDKLAKDSGPMSLIHLIILKVERKTLPDRVKDVSVIYHASTSFYQVLVEPAYSYFKRSVDIHNGYVVYKLNPHWRFDELAVDKKASDILACELGLVNIQAKSH